METVNYRVLLVEDDEDDFVLTRALLTESQGWKFDLHWSKQYGEALQALQSYQPDVLLVDYDLGGFTGLDFVRETVQRGYSFPVVMLTGRGSLEVDLEAMRAGATDYLVKGEISAQMLERALRYAIGQQKVKDELRRANEELEARVRERTWELEVVQKKLFDSIEVERLRLSQELHDGSMQEIYSIIFQLEAVKKKLDTDPQAEAIAAIQASLQQVNQSLRATAGELRPPSLSPFGLEKSIRSHAEVFQSNHPELAIHLDLMQDHQQLPEQIRLALFRIYQQAMGNILQHAHASQVDIRFWFDQVQAVLEIKDNGCGFTLPENWFHLVKDGHFGLVGARERVEGAGGSLEIQSQPGEGTLIRTSLPLHGQANTAE